MMNVKLLDKDNEKFDGNLDSIWEVSSLTSTGMSLKLNFKDPLEISQGDEPH